MVFRALLLTTIFYFILNCEMFAEDHSLSPIVVAFVNEGSSIVDERNNGEPLRALDKILSENEDVLLTANSHILLTAYISSKDIRNSRLINLASSRAASMRSYCKKRIRLITDWNFVFAIDTTKGTLNKIEVRYIAHKIPYSMSSDIHYVGSSKSYLDIEKSVRKYKRLPFLEDIEREVYLDRQERAFENNDDYSTSPVETFVSDSMNFTKKLIALYFRWDKYYLDKKYLSNERHLALLDSILTSRSAEYIDSLTIVSYASPEGSPAYNQRLSAKRGATIESYIQQTYPGLSIRNLKVLPKGENWAGFLKLAEHDAFLPHKEAVLRILKMEGISNAKRQSMVVKLDSGRVYYRYILPYYYRYLRNGASVLIEYNPKLPTSIPSSVSQVGDNPSFVVLPFEYPKLTFTPSSYCFVALKTNLLYDFVGAINLGVELPLSKRVSIELSGMYSYWQLRNLYALQILQAESSLKYWFDNTQIKNTYRKGSLNPDPLRGLFVGVYGMYCSRYDVQYIDGYQGDGFWSTGLSLGYAYPINNNWSLSAELSAGYFFTPQYRHYHRPDQGHLMWQETGRYGTLSLTKVSISLVWLLAFRKKGLSYAK